MNLFGYVVDVSQHLFGAWGSFAPPKKIVFFCIVDSLPKKRTRKFPPESIRSKRFEAVSVPQINSYCKKDIQTLKPLKLTFH